VKTKVADLALFGGAPEFSRRLHVGAPNAGDRSRLMARFAEILERRWFTNDGPVVREFEGRIAELVGVSHCVATCNATLALALLGHALGLSGEVIVPAFTFVASPHALRWIGLEPIFCEIDPETHNLDPRDVESRISPKTSAILGVHLWGRPCDVEALGSIAGRHGVRLLFDAAHAFGSSYGERMVGTAGVAEVFSFHATKFLNSFEGGAIVTNDGHLAADLRRLRNFGFEDYDRVVSLGINAKMSEVSAAMGLTSLEAMAGVVESNRARYEGYVAELEGVQGVRLARYEGPARFNYQYVVVEIDRESAGLDRDQLHSILWAENVLARRYFFPGCHRQEPYRSERLPEERRLPATDRLARRVLCLPTGPSVDPEDVSRICELIRWTLARGAELRGLLEGGNPASGAGR
jgi:dTDP-4-amino-4,6-dideoxygalactose transaminase